MDRNLVGPVKYTIMDPAGNITALVESEVEVSRQLFVSGEIMRRHPEVEQTGFMRITGRAAGGPDAELRMAGGEFCGNASACAAALFSMRANERPGAEEDSSVSVTDETVLLRVSGCVMLSIIQGLYILREDEDEEIQRIRREARERKSARPGPRKRARPGEWEE